MSGTSLDGLDICCCTFRHTDAEGWSFTVDAARDYAYPTTLKRQLGTEAQLMSAREFITLHSAYGKFLGERVNDFIREFGVHPDVVASHGHTIFHQPEQRVMFQIGDGAAIAAETRLPTVSDFRRLDIMLGGQGAPLVPIGDRLLFANYDYCLNLGGFSNISFEWEGKRSAFDICPVNYVINHYCRQLGEEFDRDGNLARSGTIDHALLDALNSLDFYRRTGPKSLGREWVEQEIFPLMERYALTPADRLRTFYEHVACQIAATTERYPIGKQEVTMLTTGGGAFNKFLVERIEARCHCRIIVPDAQVINYKEAIIFAFLGVLYLCDLPGCLASVTGAATDNIGGMLFKC
jgi:anhydro-N-acetylmuramic acid kinase